MISFERSEKEIKEKKEQAFHPRPRFPIFPPSRPIATAKPFTIPQPKLNNLKCTKGKIEFCLYICSCFMTSDCQIHFTRATDFFRIKYYNWSWRSIWRLNGSEDKTYHRGGQNANRGQTCFIIT